VAGGEADPLDAGRGHSAQHLGELRLAVDVAPVRVDVLTEQCDLEYTLRDELLGLAHDVLEGSGSFAATYVWHDAVAAEVVAANGDGNPRMPWMLALRRKVGSEVVRLRENLDLRLTLGDDRLEQRRQVGDVVRAEHHVDVRDLAQQRLAVPLADAPAHRDELAGTARLDALERAHLSAKPLVGVLSHAARHEHDDIGVFGELDCSESLRGE